MSRLVRPTEPLTTLNIPHRNGTPGWLNGGAEGKRVGEEVANLGFVTLCAVDSRSPKYHTVLQDGHRTHNLGWAQDHQPLGPSTKTTRRQDLSSAFSFVERTSTKFP